MPLPICICPVLSLLLPQPLSLLCFSPVLPGPALSRLSCPTTATATAPAIAAASVPAPASERTCPYPYISPYNFPFLALPCPAVAWHGLAWHGLDRLGFERTGLKRTGVAWPGLGRSCWLPTLGAQYEDARGAEHRCKQHTELQRGVALHRYSLAQDLPYGTCPTPRLSKE